MKDLIISDGHIYDIKISLNQIEVYFCSCEEKKYQIIFQEAVSIKGFSPINEELSSIKCENNTIFKDETNNILDEEVKNFTSYQFISAWSDSVILEIIASSIYVKTI